MFAPSALLILASVTYSKPSHPPDDGLNPSMTIRSTESRERMTSSQASPEQQRQGDGTVRDRNDADQTNTGLWPDPEADNRVVIPRQ